MNDLIGKFFGRYHILEQLGEGGMATVYKAYDTRLERDVAVKVIRTERLTIETMPRALKRFEREAKSLGKLTHPNIVPVSDYGEYEGKPYLVMPYLPGGTLKQKMGKAIPWQEAIQLLLPIAEALDYAHSQNMIHRDVKPANILLTQRGQPMLTDFGIAKVLDLEETLDLTGTSAAVGTPEYMAPEQATAKFVDHRVDIYSLGVVLYEMVTGRKPFIADTPMAVLIKHATEALPRPTQFASNLPNDVEKVLLKALAKQPENRYQDMGELVSAFKGALTGKVSGEKADHDRKERDVIERAERERKEKEIREKQVREARRETENKEGKPVVVKPKAGGQIAYWFGDFIVLAFGIAFLSSLKNSSSSPQTTPENTQTQIIATLTQNNVQPSASEVPKSTSTPSVTLTPTPWPTEITDVKDITMRLVPAGEFIMGTKNGRYDEAPVHQVYLDTFYMDVYEVTNAAYGACVNAGACNSPQGGSATRRSYFQNPAFDNYPVVKVDWNQANTYCAWRGASLPTEAQWEKAARGTDGRTYPWGGGISCTKANYFLCEGDTTQVGSYESGQSPYGMYDMAGNVAEWVKDWYDANYYASAPSSNPLGPTLGEYRVVRGGSLQNYYAKTEALEDVRSTLRTWLPPDFHGYIFEYIGFRCAKGANP